MTVNNSATLCENAKFELASANQTIQVLVYNLTSAEKQLARHDRAAARKQMTHREEKMKKLAKELKAKADKRSKFIKTSKNNASRLEELLREQTGKGRELRKKRLKLVEGLKGSLAECVAAAKEVVAADAHATKDGAAEEKTKKAAKKRSTNGSAKKTAKKRATKA